MFPSEAGEEAEEPFLGVAVPAAGSGQRMGGVEKAFLSLRGEPLLLHALRPFLEHPAVGWIVVALSPDEAEAPPDWLVELDPRVGVVAGGATRLESVGNALAAIPEQARLVAVHDAARPLVTRKVIDRCVAVALEGDGAVAGWPAVDTLKIVDEGGRVTETPDRTRLWAAHTPQIFPRALLLKAYERGRAEGARATDDSALVSRVGGVVRMVEGARWNVKVTHPDDRGVAEYLLQAGESLSRGEDRR